MPQLVFILADNMLAAGTTLPIEMWRAAASTAEARRDDVESLNVARAAVGDRPATSLAGFDIAPTGPLNQCKGVDVIYLPALWRNPRPVVRNSGPLTSWLRDEFANGALIAAVGTGCCLLAETGLLDHKAATTHWHYFDQFSRAYPLVDLKREYFITQAGTLYCAASVNALADVTVHLIERFYGRSVASHVERNFSHEIRRPYEKYRFLQGDKLQHTDEEIIEIQLWLQTHLADPIRIVDLARQFGFSTRTLERRFRLATGEPPLRYLQQERINTAKELLGSTNLSIGEIAFRVGYHDQGHFSRLFARLMEVRPNEYRKMVRAKIFSA